MIRLMADADLNYAIVTGCWRREPAIDFLSAAEGKLEAVPDPQVLALAARKNRILVSHDFQTMPHHFGGFLRAGNSSPGLFLIPQHIPVSEAVEELLLIWAATHPSEWRNRFVRIPIL